MTSQREARDQQLADEFRHLLQSGNTHDIAHFLINYTTSGSREDHVAISSLLVEEIKELLNESGGQLSVVDGPWWAMSEDGLGRIPLTSDSVKVVVSASVGLSLSDYLSDTPLSIEQLCGFPNKKGQLVRRLAVVWWKELISG